MLDNVSTYSIRHVIADSIAFLESRDFLKPIDFPESALKHPRREVADALISRLKLRDIILSAVECSQHVDNLDLARKPWDEGLTLLPTIKSTHALADSCDSAFSAKLQRKLASTIPPRPIVQLGFDDAFRHLSRMFQDGQEVVKILDTTNSQCLLVC